MNELDNGAVSSGWWYIQEFYDVNIITYSSNVSWWWIAQRRQSDEAAMWLYKYTTSASNERDQIISIYISLSTL